jgi:hypothetical protein
MMGCHEGRLEGGQGGGKRRGGRAKYFAIEIISD